MKSKFGAAAAVALTGAVVAACGSNGVATPASTSGTPAGGGGSPASPLVVDTAFQLSSADPGRLIEPTGVMIAHALYDTLLTFKGDDVSKPVPDLAASYTVSADTKTYTFKLRPGVVFSDGTPVTAADVVFSYKRVKNLKSNPSFLVAGLHVSAPDAHTVVLRSDTANAAVPAIVASPSLGVINAKAARAAGASDAADAAKTDTAEAAIDKTSMGSGPYVMQSYDQTSQVSLVANPKYWGAKPKYARVVIRNVQANVQRLNVLKGESQIAVDLSPDQAAGVRGAQVVSGASPNLLFLFANRDPKVSQATANPDFQEAVRYGIDYAGLTQLAGKGSIQAAGFVPSVLFGALPENQAVTYDLARAKAALAKSGLGHPSVTVSYPTDIQMDGVSFGDLAARIQADLKKVGITLVLKGSPLATAKVDYAAGKEQMGIWAWSPDYPDPNDYQIFLPGQFVGLRAHYDKGDDRAIEALGAKAASTTDPAQRTTLYRQLQVQMNARSPIFPLIQPAQILVAASSIKNLKSNPVWLVALGELG